MLYLVKITVIKYKPEKLHDTTELDSIIGTERESFQIFQLELFFIFLIETYKISAICLLVC